MPIRSSMLFIFFQTMLGCIANSSLRGPYVGPPAYAPPVYPPHYAVPDATPQYACICQTDRVLQYDPIPASANITRDIAYALEDTEYHAHVNVLWSVTYKRSPVLRFIMDCPFEKCSFKTDVELNGEIFPYACDCVKPETSSDRYIVYANQTDPLMPKASTCLGRHIMNEVCAHLGIIQMFACNMFWRSGAVGVLQDVRISDDILLDEMYVQCVRRGGDCAKTVMFNMTVDVTVAQGAF